MKYYILYLELRNAFAAFFPNLESENVIEFQNIVCYVLKLLRIFNPNLGKRPENAFSSAFRNSGYYTIKTKDEKYE